jgi:hypothetical protein
MIVHVEQRKVKVARESENSNSNFTSNTNRNSLEFDLHTTIGIYVSRTCSDLIKQRRKENNGMELTVAKLSNITSSRRMISAIHNLHEWSQHRSLLKPMIDDMYFQLPEGYDPSNVSPTNGFNAAQSKTIAIAECMFNDLFDRMHIVHGPPGMLLFLFMFSLKDCMYCGSFRHRQKSNNRRHRIETIIQNARIKT